jgi:hypothetical protein
MTDLTQKYNDRVQDRMIKMAPPVNDYEALVLALRLSLTAPSEEKFDSVMGLADSYATKVTPEQLTQAKLQAIVEEFLCTLNPASLEDEEVAHSYYNTNIKVFAAATSVIEELRGETE